MENNSTQEKQESPELFVDATSTPALDPGEVNAELDARVEKHINEMLVKEVRAKAPTLEEKVKEIALMHDIKNPFFSETDSKPGIYWSLLGPLKVIEGLEEGKNGVFSLRKEVDQVKTLTKKTAKALNMYCSLVFHHENEGKRSTPVLREELEVVGLRHDVKDLERGGWLVTQMVQMKKGNHVKGVAGVWPTDAGFQYYTKWKKLVESQQAPSSEVTEPSQA